MKQFVKIIPIILLLLFLKGSTLHVYAETNSIEINLGVEGCNNNGVCEAGETALSCPVDCATVIPPTGGGGGIIIPQDNFYLYNLSIQSNFTNAIIHWDSSMSTISTIRWGKTTEVKEGTLSRIVFERNHNVEIINLKPGTMYYFTIESKDINGKININPPIYFFTKFLKDTAFPLNPRNVKTFTNISGITITWQNPPDSDFSYIRIMRHEDRFRAGPFLGKLIYEGQKENFLDKEVLPGKKYFYAIFARDTAGNFSSGVAVSQTAYYIFEPKEKIPKKTEPKEIIIPSFLPSPLSPTSSTFPPSFPPKTYPPVNFFIHQYGKEVLALGEGEIELDGRESIIVDTNLKTFPDDVLEVRKKSMEEIVGQFLFSFNKDSGRYQSVIPPLEEEGIYEARVLRYIDDRQEIIARSLLLVKEGKAKTDKDFYGFFNFKRLNLAWCIIFLIFILILLFLLLRRFQKRQEK